MPACARPTLVFLLTVIVAPASGAFDTARPAVQSAYSGAASDDKVAAALEGVRELLTVRDLLRPPSSGSAGFVGGNITAPSAPWPPAVTILSTITAGSDADLAVFGDPLILDGTLLDVTADFSSGRDVVIAVGGAVIDTHAFALELDGVVSADGLLIKQGSGSLRLNGANVWNVAPFVREGRLVGTTSSLATDLHTYVAPPYTDPVAVTIEFDQDFDGSYEHAINPGPILLAALQPNVNLVKSGNGTVTASVFGRLGAGTTHVRAGALLLDGQARIGSGALTVDADATLDMRGSTRTALQVGALAGAGDILIGEVEFTTAHHGTSTFDGVVSGNNYFGFLGNPNAPATSRLTLTAPQAVSGITQVRHGTLALSGAGALHAEAVVDVATSSAVFDISGAADDREVGRIAGFGRIELGDNALMVGRNGESSDFSGTIAGSGELIKLGDGSLNLTGTTAHTGVTRVVGGRLRAASAALGAVVINDAELELFQDIDTERQISAYSGAISGTGHLIKTGDGLLWLRGENRHTGGTSIEAGVLIGNTASLPGDIAIGDAAAFYQVHDGRYDGALSGPGALLVFGPGRVSLHGANSHGGGTFFSGHLRAAEAGNLGAAHSPLAFVGGTLELAGDINSSHAVYIAAQGGTLDTAGHEFALLGSLAGDGHWRKTGPGRLRVGGHHDDFSGVLELIGGRAALDGSLGGDLIVGRDATLEVTVTERSVSRLELTGSDSRATLAGGQVAVTAAAGRLPKRVRRTLLSAPGGISGRFDSLISDVAGYDVTLGYTSNEVLLALVRSDESFATYAASPAHARVAAALDGLRTTPGSAARAALDALNLLSAEELPLALESIGGFSRDGIERSLGQSVRAINQLVTQRVNRVDTSAMAVGRGSASPLFAGAALGLGLAHARPQAPHGAWLSGFGGTGEIETSAIASDQDVLLGGLAAGYDRLFGSRLTAGVLAVVSEATLDQGAPAARTAVDTWQLGGYARWRGERVYVDGSVSYSGHDYNQRRELALGPASATARSDFDGHTWSTRLESGYGYKVTGAIRIEPYAALHHLTHETDRYRERGAGALDLAVAAHRDTAVRSELGARVAVALDTPAVDDAGVYAYAAWAHELTGESAATARLAGDATGIALPLRAIDPADHAARFGAGFHFLGGERLRIVFGFDGEVDARQMFLNASVGLNYAW